MAEISVIIPFNNSEKYISKCLSALIYQSLPDIQIICINNASCDNSKDMVQHFARNDGRIILLDNESRKTAAELYNQGIKAAEGRYISFLEPEGWCSLDMYEKLYKTALDNNSDIVMCQIQLYDDLKQALYTNETMELKEFSQFGSDSFRAADNIDGILNSPSFIWNKIYKSEFLLKNNITFEESSAYYEELPFSASAFINAEKINIVWEKLYFHRVNMPQERENTAKKAFDKIPALLKTYDVFKQADFFPKIKLEIISSMIDDVFSCFMNIKEDYMQSFYYKMKEFFLFLNSGCGENGQALLKCAYFEEFEFIIKSSFMEFLKHIIENNRTVLKHIKETEQKFSFDIQAEKDYIKYLEEYMQEMEQENAGLKQEREEYARREVKKAVKKAVKLGREKRRAKLALQFKYLQSKKDYEMKVLYEEMEARLQKQAQELKDWEKEALRRERERITAEYEIKLAQEKQQGLEALKIQKNYYENRHLLVKILLKAYRFSSRIKNRALALLKKN